MKNKLKMKENIKYFEEETGEEELPEYDEDRIEIIP